MADFLSHHRFASKSRQAEALVRWRKPCNIQYGNAPKRLGEAVSRPANVVGKHGMLGNALKARVAALRNAL